MRIGRRFDSDRRLHHQPMWDAVDPAPRRHDSDLVALTRTAQLVATAFSVNGVLHIVKPSLFDSLMPEWLPAHREVNIAVGVAELGCAAALAVPATRPVGGLVGTGLLLAVFPGNVQMAVGAMGSDNRPLQAAALARLPLQWPMLRAMWRTWRG